MKTLNLSPRADRLIEAAKHDADPWRAQRNVALVALLCWSGLPPGTIRPMRWESVCQWDTGPDGSMRVRRDVRGQMRALIVGAPAVERLQAFWRACGKPPAGPIFRRAPDVPHALNDGTAKYILQAACREADLRVIDRRHLRAPDALSLLDEGWDSRALALAFGYKRSREVLELIRPVEELRAQVRTTEQLTLERSRPGSLEPGLVSPAVRS